MPQNPHGHIPVLLSETLEHLQPAPGQTAIDATAGRGGHAEAIFKQISPHGTLLIIDRDAENLAYARNRLANFAESQQSRILIHHGSFAHLRQAMRSNDLPAADIILADLGFASNQMDTPERGFSFAADGPLDMRLDPTSGTSAADLINQASQAEIADIIHRFGEDRLARRIAAKIVEARKERPIVLTSQLAELVRVAYGHAVHKTRTHPATRTFMALRIAVNQELPALESLLDQIPQALAPLGRLAVISFHSLEDRIVKQTFARWSRDARATLTSRKPIEPSIAESTTNPRSRSAKLRTLIWQDASTRT
ncbi:16S rRNA (cytosine(1402)-N(4))-methyltransferase RsmH [Mucisphaera sp.]|uniref:16S rRNA (cytosine(1402)-N(4))-methyltransferase RsmH n=1 Tax=Mucisphaera sp. TaxID=2913024 RepID=UPI003D11E2D6